MEKYWKDRYGALQKLYKDEISFESTGNAEAIARVADQIGADYVVAVTSPGREKRCYLAHECVGGRSDVVPFNVILPEDDNIRYWVKANTTLLSELYELTFMLPLILFGRFGSYVLRYMAKKRRGPNR